MTLCQKFTGLLVCYCAAVQGSLSRRCSLSLKTLKQVRELWVLLGYPIPDFQSIEKPKGGPLEIEKNFVEGG